MLRVFPAFWYSVSHPGIEPTNDTGEQEIRYGVLSRKTSQGTQSHLGSEFVATIFTVRATLRKHERNMLEFITEVGLRFGRLPRHARASAYETSSISGVRGKSVAPTSLLACEMRVVT